MPVTTTLRNTVVETGETETTFQAGLVGVPFRFLKPLLVLQRRLWREAGGVTAEGSAAFLMRASGPFVALLDAIQP